MKPGSSEVTVTLCHTDQLIIDCQNQYTLRARSGAQATTVCHSQAAGHLRPVSCLLELAHHRARAAAQLASRVRVRPEGYPAVQARVVVAR